MGIPRAGKSQQLTQYDFPKILSIKFENYTCSSSKMQWHD